MFAAILVSMSNRIGTIEIVPGIDLPVEVAGPDDVLRRANFVAYDTDDNRIVGWGPEEADVRNIAKAFA